ncbi:MAG: vanadium-dependent haloperoxidase [Chloroflexota bacterium]
MTTTGGAPQRSLPPRTFILVAIVAVTMVLGGVLAVAQPWAGSACRSSASPSEWSVARRWDEALLNAIRRALPAPTVHARNLFHVSAAMWDAWAAYDSTASGHFVKEKHRAFDATAARNEAISYAAYRVLSARYIKAVGGDVSLSEFADLMDALCYPLAVTTTEGDSPAAIGNRIAEAILAFGRTDGSNETGGYAGLDYAPVNPPLTVASPGNVMTDPDRWQPLQIEHMISQNGIPVTNGVQQFVGPHWGHVTGFALPATGPNGVPIDPGPPPRLGDPATNPLLMDQLVGVIRDSSLLDPADTTMIDISPGARGANPLGTNDGRGHPINPATGLPYAPDVVSQADFGRVMAEFWADGPKSETPPGHWNTIANVVSDELAPDLQIGGEGPTLDRLQWDVKLYFALNGAVHDAAIAAWGLKGYYDSSRPISLIRYLGETRDDGDRQVLTPVPGLIEFITPETTAPGQRHEALAGHESEIAIRAWAGIPEDPKTQVGGVRWMLAGAWVPYQLPTFVTPAFAGYISGHSTFSRAAAEVLTGFTGSEYFPGGVSGYTISPGSLKFEAGPTKDVRLEWGTYYDAADQAGQSRIWGGIHIQADDFTGRRIGAECGINAWALAQRYYTGAIDG